ncbi:hypothetical protein [Chromobacterium sphagni]|uniref:hypothetical protein n=1 Tax=Chromobacterium sphagni TaxID=1903179 RepID=UPI001113B5EE|nr:hypothetical protein [Chromobacterium sphagni]
MALALDEIASPSSLFSFHLPAGDTALKIEQVSGPALLSVHPQSGSKVNLITGPDSGKQEIVRLRIQGRQRQYLASFGQLTLIGQSHDSMLEPDEGGKMDDLSDLAVLPSATTLGTTLSDQAGPQTIALRSPSNRRLSSLLATLDNGKDAFDLGEHITLQGNGQITLHTAKLKPLLLPGRLHELFLSGWDSQGGSFNQSFYFYYASNRIHGQLKQGNAQTAAELQNAVVALRGFGNRLSWVSRLSADGRFDFGTVPIDNYLVELVDPDERHSANALFLVKNPGQTIFVPLELAQPNSAAKVRIRPLGLDNTPLKRPSPSKSRKVAMPPRAFNSQGLGLVIVASAQENVTEQQEKEVSIPVGVNKINIQAIVHTNEYPDYSSSPGNQFNDSWRYWWRCAGQQYHQAGQVNNSHSNRTVRQFSHNLSLDPKRTAPALCRIGAAAVNIGDSIVTTSVHVQIQGERFSIDKFEYKNGLWLDDSRGGNQHYNMSLPTQLGPQFGIKRPWAMEITYSPADTPIRKVGLDLRYDGKRLPLTKDASFSLSRPGLLKVSYAATQPLPLQPVAGLAQREAVLYSDTDGVEHSTQPQAMAFPLTRKDAFQPLFEIRNVLNLPENRRYGPRDDATGGDGWLRNDMLNLLGAPPILPLLGDISGEHGWQDAAGKAMGAHSTHKGGYDADLRYWDENGRWDGPMRGDSNGAEIARVVQAARAEVKNGAPAQPNLNRLVNWVRWNRSQLSALESRLGPQLRKIYVGDTIWFARSLLEGRFPDSVDIPRHRIIQTDAGTRHDHPPHRNCQHPRG